MKMEFDYHELDKFADNIAKDSLRPVMQGLAKTSVDDFISIAWRNTPTVTWNLRMHWYMNNQNVKIRNFKHTYSAKVSNQAYRHTKNGKVYYYGSYVDQGHQSFNQFGGPYVVRHSKYGKNGGPVIGRFIVSRSAKKMRFKLREDVQIKLQQWLDRCVENAK